MISVPTEYLPWLALIGLGLFHGINPAMGWLFAVALGLHRNNQRVVLVSLIPIAIGHIAAIISVLIAVTAIGVAINTTALMRISGVILLGLALWHIVYGHHHRVRIGMRTGLAGLLLWSFLMANAHGAGFMLIPALVPLCVSGSTAAGLAVTGSMSTAVSALAVHMAAMLAAIITVSLVVYRWAGVGFLRRGWVNLDLIWVAILAVFGLVLVGS